VLKARELDAADVIALTITDPPLRKTVVAEIVAARAVAPAVP
jgi:hypothetical protein